MKIKQTGSAYKWILWFVASSDKLDVGDPNGSHRAPCIDWLHWDAVDNYRNNRENGTLNDNPKRRKQASPLSLAKIRSLPFPEDGKYKWTKGRYEGGYIHGVDQAFYYEYELTYYPGPRDKTWMEEKDRNYLARIEQEGTLKKLEPAIWYLRQQEQAVDDIRNWWTQKLLLPNLSQILQKTEQIINQSTVLNEKEKKAKAQQVAKPKDRVMLALTRVQFVINEAKQLLLVIQSSPGLQSLSQQEQQKLREYYSFITQLTVSEAMGETKLTEYLVSISNRNREFATLPKRLNDLFVENEKRKRVQKMISDANKLLLNIQVRSDLLQLLSEKEQSELKKSIDFIRQLKVENIASNELNGIIILLGAENKYLEELPQKLKKLEEEKKLDSLEQSLISNQDNSSIPTITVDLQTHKLADSNTSNAYKFEDLYKWLLSIKYTEEVERRNAFGLSPYNVQFAVGDCLFAAIAACDLNGRSAANMRSLAVERIKKDEGLKASINALVGYKNTTIRLGSGEDVVYDSWKRYVAYMERAQTWGTELELVALARVLNRPIVILTPNVEYVWIIEENEYMQNDPIFVEYQGDNHYVPLETPKDPKETLGQIRAVLNAKKEKSIAVQSKFDESSVLAASPISFWYFKCKDHAAPVIGEKRQNEQTAKIDLKQHRQEEHGGLHVGKVKCSL